MGWTRRQQGWSAPIVIAAEHITVESRQRESYLAGCVCIVEQAHRAVSCLDIAICADRPSRPGRVSIFGRWQSQAPLESFRGSGPDAEQRRAMLTVSVEEYDIADVRAVFGEEYDIADVRAVFGEGAETIGRTDSAATDEMRASVRS
jgi:hypothetical protein